MCGVGGGREREKLNTVFQIRRNNRDNLGIIFLRKNPKPNHSILRTITVVTVCMAVFGTFMVYHCLSLEAFIQVYGIYLK